MSEGIGWYAYGVVPTGAELAVDTLEGVDPEFGVEVLECGDVAAVASRVRLAEFGEAALQRNLEDREWLERTALAHDAVVSEAMSTGAVVPMRLCTIFSGRERLLSELRQEESALREELRRVQGRAEWAVKVLLDPAVSAGAGEGSDPDAGAGAGEGAARESTASSGRDYFARKRRERTVREDAEAAIDTAVGDIHEQLRHHATATAVLRPQNADLSGRRGRMVHNGAYLVESGKADDFVAAATELAEAQRSRGLELEVTGPWAPYNFVTTAGAQ